MYIMRKMNREKRAVTETQKKELEAKGYQYINETEDTTVAELEEPEEKQDKAPEKKKQSGKSPADKNKKTESMNDGEADVLKDGGGNGDIGKD